MSNIRPIVVCSDGGGSGFENLVHASRDGRMPRTKVAAVFYRNAEAGTLKRAAALGIPRVHLVPELQEPQAFENLVKSYAGDDYLLAASGALWRIPIKEEGVSEFGIEPRRGINIHPGLLPLTAGLHGEAVHKKVIVRQEYKTAIHMHFLTRVYDDGPQIFKQEISVPPMANAEILQRAVNGLEHLYQPYVTGMVAQHLISWSGRKDDPVRFPEGYPWKP